MANKPKAIKHCNRHSLAVADLPLPLDLSKELTSIFDIKSRKQERISAHICRNIRKTKLKALERLGKTEITPAVLRPATSKEFRALASGCPITDMSRFQEKCIRKKIECPVLEKRFPQLVEDIIKDAKLQFRNVTHRAGLNLKVKDKHLEDFTITCYKHLGKTENYEKYLCIRRQFEIRWILHYELIRNFLKECDLGLPYQLFKLHIPKVLNLGELQDLFIERVQSSAVTLHDFDKHIRKLFDAACKRQLYKFLPACTGLFSIYVSSSIEHTMEQIVEFTGSAHVASFLRLSVSFEMVIVLQPTEDQVVKTFHNLLDDLVNAGQELNVMERGFIKGHGLRKICLGLTQDFIGKCKRKIAQNISKLYEPILEYLSRVESKFCEIYTDINSEDKELFVDVLFEDGCQRIQFYEKFLRKVDYLPDNEYFEIGQVDLTGYRETLHSSLRTILDSIFENLSFQHLWEVNDICDTFRLIRARARQIPFTTEELIETGKFMNWVKNEQLDELTERVRAALSSLCNIITLGLLDEEHMMKNSEALNWLEDILPIIEQHSTAYEHFKFEAEEKLQKVIEEISVIVCDLHPLLVILDKMDDVKRARKYLSQITLHMTKIKDIESRIDWINKEEVCLNFPQSSYPDFENLKDYVYPFYHLLKLSLDIQKHVSVWQNGQFDCLDFESANTMVEKFSVELESIHKKYRKRLRQAQDENLPIRFKGTVDDPDILNWPAPLKLCRMSLNILAEFKPSLTIMKIMCNNALQLRHWKAMSEIAGFNLMPNAGTTLKKMVEFDLKEKLHEYDIISTCATKEQQLMKHLNSLKAEWENVFFTVRANNEAILILVELDEIKAMIEDHTIKILNMRSSVFVKPYELEVADFYNTIQRISLLVNKWAVFQSAYLKLLPIFKLEEVLDSIPKEKALFRECQEFFEKYTNKISEAPEIVGNILETNIEEDMKVALAILEQVQKGVDVYLETIRLKCPRLYFVSNQEAMAFIATSGIFGNCNVLSKLFPSIDTLVLSSESKEIIAIKSFQGEEVPLRHTIFPTTVAETLNRLQTAVVNSLQHNGADCYKVYKKTPIRDLVKKYPQQVLQVMARVFWTDQVENALKLSHNIKLLICKKNLESSIEEKIDIISDSQVSQLDRVVLRNLLITDLNNQYLLSSFVKDGLVIDDSHFDWQVQLRYYFKTSLCSMQVMKHSLDYGYEYLGNSDQIVLTPLTDRCFVALLNAFFFHSFGFVWGKKQTGKTTTVKALAEAIGKLFLYFICMTNLAVEPLLQLFKGTVLCGAWLSLKHFEQLEANVLSVISQELLNILDCKKRTLEGISFGGSTQLAVDSGCFIIGQLVTEQGIKPELPENLKVLFRTFTLSQPDLGVIVECLLACKGIKGFKRYSKQICRCFALLEDSLCSEKQYVFKLAEAKKLLVILEEVYYLNPTLEFSSIICQSFAKAFLPSLTSSDQETCMQVLSDVFQDYFSPVQSFHEDIEAELHSNLVLSSGFSKRVADLYACLKRTAAVILLGNTFTAKTTALKTCARLFKKLNNADVLLHVLNPNCIAYKDLIGQVSMNKNIRWIDGVLLRILRRAGKEENWILFDGYMEGIWRKELSSVVEDGTLCLESLEVLKLNEDLRLIFEATSLQNASPSMVSGCTTIYFAPDTLPYTSLVDVWLKTCQSYWLTDHHAQIEELFKWFLPPCLEAFKSLLVDQQWNVDDNILVRNTLTYFQLILDDASLGVNRKEEDPKNLQSWIHATCLQAGVLGFSAFLSCEGQQKFDEFFKQLWKGQNPTSPYPSCLERLEVGIPADGILIDYRYLYKQRGAWKLWTDLLKNEKMLEMDLPRFVCVPTVDTMKCKFFMDLHIKHDKQFLVVGPKSTGKSLTFKDCFLNRLPEKDFDKILITLGSHMTPDLLQRLLLAKMIKKRYGLYAPKDNKRLICFIDDLHCCSKQSSTLDFLRQQLDHNVWSDLKNWENASLEGATFIASYSGKGLSKRFLRHFNVFSINQLGYESVSRIFVQILTQTWKKASLPNDVVNAASLIVGASLQVYSDIGLQMKPTLNKCHYLFDINSLAKVIQGCGRLRKDTYDGNKKIHIRLWVHEVFRVFADRFISEEDLQILTACVKKTIARQFPAEDLSELFGELPFNQLFFATFQNKSYDEINFVQLQDMCIQSLQDYNSKSQHKLDLLLFDYVLEYLARVFRLLAIPQENALLIGLSGYGRQSLTKFASFISKIEFFQSTITSKYNGQRWKEDFKSVLKLCGGVDKKCVFFASEQQLLQDQFLGILDHYLRDGDVTDLYEAEEKQELLELTRLAAQGGNQNLDISSHKVFLYFNSKCRENCHLFLSLSPSLGSLRARLLAYPSLAIRTNIIFWNEWPNSALTFISTHAIRTLELTNEIKDRASLVSAYLYQSCQGEFLKNYVTPKAYFHFNRLFVDLIGSKQKLLKAKKLKFEQGLAKLSYAASQILKMQMALAEYQPQLEKMTENAINMTDQIALETIQVEKASALVRKDEKTASQQAAVAEVLKSECESELAQAIPILEDAISALNTLKPSDITLVKSMKNPPDAIKLVMASVCVIKDVKPDRIPDPSTGRKSLDYWGPSKRILGDMNFLQTLKDFDKDHIKPEVMAKIRKDYLPHKDFKPHVVAKASSAAEGLCKWIIAMDMYDRVAKEVAPKKEKLNKAEREYADTMTVLSQKKEEVVRIEEKLAQLHALLEEATKKQRKLQIEVDICNKKLYSAQKLIGGLSGERRRWTEAAARLQRHYEVLAGDLLLSSAIISYLPSLHHEARHIMLTKWQNNLQENHISFSEDFQLTSVLSSDVEVQHWVESGLPTDSFFIENAIIFNNSKHFCLLLDPHAQALQWIINLESCNSLIVTEFTFEDWLERVIYCLVHGKPVLIKDSKGLIPASLHHFLCGQRVAENGDVYVTVDGQLVKMNKFAKVYIVCCNSTANYGRDITSRLTVINFALTLNALKEDVLNTVVEIENPAIRKYAKELTQQNKENKAELKELEAKILNTLCESEADILEDEESIVRLDKSKELTKIVMEKQAKAVQLAQLIDDFKSKYFVVANHVACLFFCTSKLTSLHHLYQFSLKWFKNIYFTSILNAGKSKNFQSRCENLCDTFTFDLHKSISKGLFEEHKLLFTLWLAMHVVVSKGFASQEDVALFFQWKDLEAVTVQVAKPDWVEQKTWLNLLKLEQSQLFQGIVKSFINNYSTWLDHLEANQIPKEFQRLNPVGRLILAQALRPEKIFRQIRAFIESILGEIFLLPMLFDMQETFNESYNLLPILFFLTPGLDVLKKLHNFASVKRVLHNFSHLSLSETNCQSAEELIKQGQKTGAWILLQNCHYTGKWLFRLEQILNRMDFENTNENFRLFLTTSEKHDLPLELIQNSIKIVDEPPASVRRNLLRIYKSAPLISDDYFYGCPGQQESFSKLLLRLCYFHVLLQQRQKVRNWNIMWRFEETDLMLSLAHLKDFVNEKVCLFEKVYYVIGDCIYNGHLDRDHERDFVTALLRNCINAKAIEKNPVHFNALDLPSKNDRQDYLVYVHSLPDEDPAGFLHLTDYELAEQTLLTTTNFMNSGAKMLATQGPHTFNHDEILVIVDELLRVLPANVNRKFSETFLTREKQMYNRLLETIRTDLGHLRLAVQGDLQLDDTLNEIAAKIFQNKLPEAWLRLCYPTLASLPQFMRNVSENVCFFENWSQSQNTYLTRAFFFPPAILAFITLKYAREEKVLPENIGFQYKVVADNAQEGLGNFSGIFTGLFLLGARFDRNCGLVELLPTTAYSLLPSISIQPMVEEKKSSTIGLKCGIFKTRASFDFLALPGADNFVTYVNLPCQDEGFWLNRGVCIVSEAEVC